MPLKLKRPESVMMTTKEAANYMGLSAQTLNLDRHRAAKHGVPLRYPYIRLGKAVRYRKRDLEDCLEANRVV